MYLHCSILDLWAKRPVQIVRSQGREYAQARVVCTENSDTNVMMMQSAEKWARSNRPLVLNWARNRCILVQGAVGSDLVVIASVGGEDTPQMGFTDHHDMVEAFASDRANEPFHVPILPR